MRHALHWHLLGSAGLAFLIGRLTGLSSEQTWMLFLLMAVGWGCVTNAHDAWQRWRTQRNPYLALGMVWNLGLAVWVWIWYRSGWPFWASVLALLGYSVIPWGMGRLGIRWMKNWRNETRSR